MGQRMDKERQHDDRVLIGLDRLLDTNFAALQGGRVGVISNASSVFQNMKHLVDVLHSSKDVEIVAIFGPEHGFRSATQAGTSEGFGFDTRTGLPIYDIYQKSGKSLETIFAKAEIDILLFDMQDVGARFYTYIWTLYDCMVAAAICTRPMKVVVADRPNPVGGSVVDGSLLDSKMCSFVGRKSIPLRHGMTVGEIAKLFNAEFVVRDVGKQVHLEVLTLRSWDRRKMFSDTGLIWVAPSPNMPTPLTALLYLGMALFEGTNCSEGRGTTLPFQMIGAPWIDQKLISYLQEVQCPGALFREASFTPTSSKFVGTTVHGLQVHVKDLYMFNPIRAALTIIAALLKLYPQKFEWLKSNGTFWVDRLVGNAMLRELLNGGASVDEVIASWQDDITWFGEIRKNYLLY